MPETVHVYLSDAQAAKAKALAATDETLPALVRRLIEAEAAKVTK